MDRETRRRRFTSIRRESSYLLRPAACWCRSWCLSLFCPCEVDSLSYLNFSFLELPQHLLRAFVSCWLRFSSVYSVCLEILVSCSSKRLSKPCLPCTVLMSSFVATCSSRPTPNAASVPPGLFRGLIVFTSSASENRSSRSPEREVVPRWRRQTRPTAQLHNWVLHIQKRASDHSPPRPDPHVESERWDCATGRGGYHGPCHPHGAEPNLPRQGGKARIWRSRPGSALLTSLYASPPLSLRSASDLQIPVLRDRALRRSLIHDVCVRTGK